MIMEFGVRRMGLSLSFATYCLCKASILASRNLLCKKGYNTNLATLVVKTKGDDGCM